MAAQQSHTFASRTNRDTWQSLQKSVTASTQKEFKNIFPSLLKKVNTPHTTQRQTNDSRNADSKNVNSIVFQLFGGQKASL